MELIEKIIGKTVTEVTAADIFGAIKIASGVFYSCTKLTSISFPETVEEIGKSAFQDCAALQSIDLIAIKKIGASAFSGCNTLTTVNTESLPENCEINYNSFIGTPWIDGLPDGLNLLADGKIAFYAKNVTAVEIPDSVRAISECAFDKVAAPSIVVPDTVVHIWGNAFGNSATTKVTIGAGVQIMGVGTMGNAKVTTWICRQPINMTLDIPKETGDGKGLAYKKDARSFTLYTDNEMLKAYNWSGDNVTATIKPLSEAPA